MAFYPLMTARNPRDGTYFFEFCPLQAAHAWKLLSEKQPLTISMRGQRATGKIRRNNDHHGSCGPSLMGKMIGVFHLHAGDASECQKLLSKKLP